LKARLHAALVVLPQMISDGDADFDSNQQNDYPAENTRPDYTT